jgi:hypothetical protein
MQYLICTHVLAADDSGLKCGNLPEIETVILYVQSRKSIELLRRALHFSTCRLS